MGNPRQTGDTFYHPVPISTLAMNSSLYLFPRPVLEEPPAMEAVIAVLRGCGFLGEPLDPGLFRVGGGFFRHITFAGCSPHLKLEPESETDGDFTCLRLWEERVPRLRIAPQRGRPRCPACRTAVAGWKERLSDWKQDATGRWVCPACGKESRVAELDWRQYGVAARLLVEVTRVWPGEALPTDGLLAELGAGTGRAWGFAWAEGGF